MSREIRPRGVGAGKVKVRQGSGEEEWLPLPEGWYKGLTEGAMWVQVRYAKPWETGHTAASFEVQWAQRVGRRIAGVDPGVRVLYTIYDPSRSAYIRVGYGWSSYMDRCVHRRIRQLQASIVELSASISGLGKTPDDAAKLVALTREKVEREEDLAAERLGAAKRSRAIEDVSFLVLSSYDVLILPKFGGRGMGERGNSLSSHVTRRMRYHRYYDVRERLKQHAVITGSILDVGLEMFSTQACPGCAEQNPTVGASKFHQCRRRGGNPLCGRWDRDCGSARTILLLHIGKYLPEVAAVFAEPAGPASLSLHALGMSRFSACLLAPDSHTLFAGPAQMAI